MKYVNLGNSDIKVSRIALGCMSYDITGRRWHKNEENGRVFIQKALELGINFFDTANMYSDGESEEVLGRAIHDFTSRDKVIIATKLFYPMRDDLNAKGLSRKAIMAEIDASLIRLKTDYVDLYQIHRWDYDTPIEETLEALNDIVKAGKVRYLGASSMFAWQFCKSLYLADKHNWTRFISMQPHYNLLNREEEREMLPLCLSEKIAVLPWSPLARGRLARPWRTLSSSDRVKDDLTAKELYNDFEKSDEKIVNNVVEIAASRDITCAEVSLAWLLNQPSVTSPIVGATQLLHLQEAVSSLEISLSIEEMNKLTVDYIPHPLVGFK